MFLGDEILAGLSEPGEVFGSGVDLFPVLLVQVDLRLGTRHVLRQII